MLQDIPSIIPKREEVGCNHRKLFGLGQGGVVVFGFVFFCEDSLIDLKDHGKLCVILFLLLWRERGLSLLFASVEHN